MLCSFTLWLPLLTQHTMGCGRVVNGVCNSQSDTKCAHHAGLCRLSTLKKLQLLHMIASFNHSTHVGLVAALATFTGAHGLLMMPLNTTGLLCAQRTAGLVRCGHFSTTAAKETRNTNVCCGILLGAGLQELLISNCAFMTHQATAGIARCSSLTSLSIMERCTGGHGPNSRYSGFQPYMRVSCMCANICRTTACTGKPADQVNMPLAAPQWTW